MRIWGDSATRASASGVINRSSALVCNPGSAGNNTGKKAQDTSGIKTRSAIKVKYENNQAEDGSDLFIML